MAGSSGASSPAGSPDRTIYQRMNSGSEVDQAQLAAKTAILANQLPRMADGQVLQIQIRHTGNWLTINDANDLAVINNARLHYNWQIANREAEDAEGGAARLFADIDYGDLLNDKSDDAKNHIRKLLARIQVWQKLRELSFAIDPEFVANAGINKQRAAKSFGHVIVEGFLKGFGLVLFAALTKSWFDGTLTEKTPEAYSRLSWGLWGGLVTTVVALSYYAIPNQYHFATRTFSELDESEMDRLYYDDAAMHTHLALEHGVQLNENTLQAWDNNALGTYRGDALLLSADKKTCQRTAATVMINEQFDAFDVAMVLFMLKIASSGAPKGWSYGLALVIGLAAGLPLKACAALANSTSQAQSKRQAEVFFTTGVATIPYDQTIPLLSTPERRLKVYKILLLGLPVLFAGVHAGAAFQLDIMKEKPLWLKGIVGLLLSLGALAKTGTYDLTRVASAIGLDRQKAAAPFETSLLNTAAYYTAAQSPKIYDHVAKRAFLLGPSYWVGLTALMFKALEAFMEGVVAPYNETTDKWLNTLVSSEDNGIKVLHIIAFVIGAWGALTQTLQGVKSFGEKAKQAAVGEAAPLLDAPASEDTRMIECRGIAPAAS